MKKNYFRIIQFVLLSGLILTLLYNRLNKKPRELEKMYSYQTEQYISIHWNDRTYVPYATVDVSDKGDLIGIVDDDENDQVYEYKDYSNTEWIVSIYHSGEMDNAMLLREINVITTPDGIESEYEWNQNTISLDSIYQHPSTKDYKDIRELDKNYDRAQALADRCFIAWIVIENKYLHDEFMRKVLNQEDAFIRVWRSTVEGDTIIYDIMYNRDSNDFTLVTDYTRDEFSNEKDRKIQIHKYEHIAEYNYRDDLYWLLYVGELNDETFTTSGAEIFPIAMIH